MSETVTWATAKSAATCGVSNLGVTLTTLVVELLLVASSRAEDLEGQTTHKHTTRKQETAVKAGETRLPDE